MLEPEGNLRMRPKLVAALLLSWKFVSLSHFMIGEKQGAACALKSVSNVENFELIID